MQKSDTFLSVEELEPGERLVVNQERVRNARHAASALKREGRLIKTMRNSDGTYTIYRVL